MKKPFCISTYFAILFLCLFMISHLHSQTVEPNSSPKQQLTKQKDNLKNSISKSIDDCKDKKKSWETQAEITRFLTLLIAFLGAITALIQTKDGKMYKIFTVCLGLIIATVTMVNNTYFPMGYQTLQNNAIQAGKIMRNVGIISSSLDRTEDDKNMDFLNKAWIDEMNNSPFAIEKVLKLNLREVRCGRDGHAFSPRKSSGYPLPV